MVTLAAHTPTYISGLPKLSEAIQTFKANGGADLVYGPLKEIISKSGATARFGITVLGQPTGASDDKTAQAKPSDDIRIVSNGSVTVPVPTAGLDAETQGKLVPVTWGFDKDSKAYPIIYALSANPGQDKLTAADIKLFGEIQAAVAKSPAGSVIGVELLAHQNAGLHVLLDNVIASLPADFIPVFPGGVVETSWTFGEGEGEVEPTGFFPLAGDAQSYGYYGGGPIIVNGPWYGNY